MAKLCVDGKISSDDEIVNRGQWIYQHDKGRWWPVRSFQPEMLKQWDFDLHDGYGGEKGGASIKGGA